MMRRNNYPYQPLNTLPNVGNSGSGNSSGSSVVRDLATGDFEEENERAAEELKEKIGALKSLTIDIGNEVRYQDKLLRGIDDDMDRTHGSLTNSMARVIRLTLNGGNNRCMCYMFLFILFVFLILYMIIKFK